MSYRLDMDPEVQEIFRHLPPARKRKIKETLRCIANQPVVGKILQEELSGLFSYRVGTLRIIYNVETSKKIVHIVAIGPRRAVYKELTREVLRLRKTRN